MRGLDGSGGLHDAPHVGPMAGNDRLGDRSRRPGWSELRIDHASVISSITGTGWTSKTRLADGTLIYRFGEPTGHFLIGGRTIVTRIESHSMQFSAAGHGRAWLIGSGSYWANGRAPFARTPPPTNATAVPSAMF